MQNMQKGNRDHGTEKVLLGEVSACVLGTSNVRIEQGNPQRYMIQLIHGDCLKEMKKMPDGSIDLTVTSPPYDNLRTYNGNNALWGEHVWKAVIQDLYRVTKQGGVVVWVVGDATIKGSETGTSFKQALWAKECGFNLHDTMIYQKNVYAFPLVNRYYQVFEYMFVWSKGSPKRYDIQRQPTDPRWRNKSNKTSSQRNPDGTTSKFNYGTGKDTRKMDNVWRLNAGYMKSTPDKEAYKHPAIFPDELAKRHIISWSNEGDVIFDPFMGSGTTGLACKNLNRNFIGIELDKEYYEIAVRRINPNEGETAMYINQA
jgi:DNA modification methylase